jgi:uncharacterized protein YneF (UPF0154 family)
MSLKMVGYDLSDNPFIQTPAISMWAVDKRLNGKLFCEEIVQEQLNKLMRLIRRQTKVVYVNSSVSVLGTGKSALMASAYWKLIDQGQNTIWTEATGGLSSSPTLGRIVDAMVAQGIFETMLNKIGEVTESRIKQMLQPMYNRPSPTSISALVNILNMSPGETAKKFANIRRSILISTSMELFGYLVSLMEACGFSRPIIFIDQFEEFVQAHRGASQMAVLGNDMNDLLRALQNKATLVLSLHPEAENVLMSAAQSYIKTFAPITSETMVTVPPMKPKEGVKLAEVYLSAYRIKGSKRPNLYPFTEDVLEYICWKTRGTPRQFLSALYEAILEGAEQNYQTIDEKFITNPSNHAKVLSDAPLEWNKFHKNKL